MTVADGPDVKSPDAEAGDGLAPAELEERLCRLFVKRRDGVRHLVRESISRARQRLRDTYSFGRAVLS